MSNEVPTNDRFERIRRALLIFSSGSILIALSATNTVSLIFTSQSASLPIWLAMALSILAVFYYWIAFERERWLIEVRERGNSGTKDLQLQIVDIRRRINDAFNDVRAIDYAAVERVVNAAFSIRAARDKGELQEFIYRVVSDCEPLIEYVKNPNPPKIAKVIDRLSSDITRGVVDIQKNVGPSPASYVEKLNKAFDSLEAQFQKTDRAIEKAETNISSIDRQLSKLSSDYTQGAKIYFGWWEVGVPRVIVFVAVALCAYNIGAGLFGWLIFSAMLG